MKVLIKPLSVNEAWQGKRFKTKKYKDYEKLLLMVLPKKVNCDFSKNLVLTITFGFSAKTADIDNPIKPLLDILQKKYNFNDKQIYELNIKKEIVSKRNEFIEIDIKET